MYKLLNKFAIYLSITLAISITTYIGFLFDMREDEFFAFSILSIPIITIIFKKLFFRAKFIKERLRFFADRIKEEILEDKIKNQEVKKDDLKILGQEKEIIKNEETKLIKDTINSKDITNEDKKIKNDILIKGLDKKTIKEEKKKISEPSEIEKFFLKAGDSFKNFFAENLLAKLGGILIFLGVAFLLFALYINIGAIGKVIIGFSIGFGIYIVGVLLETKGYKGESKILMGVGILTNYLVILGARYIIGEDLKGENQFISDTMTFLFLILNTLFAIATSLVYKSKVLLIFSFIFAYLNPFIIGGQVDTPYLMIGYSLAVSFGSLYLAKIQDLKVLLYFSFILGNILIGFAPFSNDIGWISKLTSSAILCLTNLFIVYKYYKKPETYLKNVFIGTYVFLIFLIINGNGVTSEITSYISYMTYILILFGISIYLFLETSLKTIFFTLLIPILIILGIYFNNSEFITISLSVITLTYLVGFSYIGYKLENSLRYAFFIVLGIFIFLMNSGNNYHLTNINLYSFITTIIVSFVFIITSYYFSRRKGIEFLYTIGTIGGILTLSPIIMIKPLSKFIIEGTPELINNGNTIVTLSALSVFLFFLLNFISPIFNKNLVGKDSSIKNLVIGSIFGVLFVGIELFRFGQAYFPGISLGIAFLGLALAYFFIGYVIYNKYNEKNSLEEKTNNISKDAILSYLAISISIFSFAIALVFTDHKEIISTVWLFEATILFFFFERTKDIKVYIAGIILFFIGIFNLGGLVDEVSKKEFIFLVSFALIFGSFVLNLKFLDFIKDKKERILHDVLHIIGIFILSSLLIKITPNTGHGRNILGISSFLALIAYIYLLFSSNLLKYFFIFSYIIFILSHIGQIDYILNNLEKDKKEILVVFQYISTAILGFIVYIWSKLNKNRILKNILLGAFSLYSLIIISFYVYDIFKNTFSITIFWGIIAFISFVYGIQNNTQKFRTIGLYIFGIVSSKIFLYDIRYSTDNPMIRIIALIAIGTLYIIVSILYTRRFGNNIKKELNINNIFEKDIELKKEDNNSYIVNEKISDIDISNYSGVKFIFKNGKIINIKAVNLIKIVKIILDKKQKNNFEINELKKDYDFIIANYKSELSKQNYERIKEVMEEFINEGGQVILIEKNK